MRMVQAREGRLRVGGLRVGAGGAASAAVLLVVVAVVSSLYESGSGEGSVVSCGGDPWDMV